MTDNCATFNRLIPHLNKNLGFLCIDLPGHGYSSRLPPGMFYHMSNHVILIHYLAKYFQWSKVSLMGHSMGGIASYIYSMVYPENIDFVICIDGAKPMIRKNVNIHMAKAISKFLKYDELSSGNKEPPSYTIDNIKEKISKPNNNSVLHEYSHILMERNIAPSKLHPGKYYFTRDPRIKTGELLNFPQDELTQYAQNITCPIFIAKARGGSYYEVKENFYEVLDVLKRSSKDCDFHYVDGSHHVHLNNPDAIGKLIKEFIRRHNIEDRSIGGIKDDIIVNDNKTSLNI
ncbi:hypothetical protein NQ314_007615 [Rhamnusium bicolor]|uniref:AB hydrolase-1 domain-containing protein n=1 Tax=Rhamnusium bicolor TaxID=1586634 RepID=A0AAV8YL84_9CUCU|nr:hypothetical protein NQ314_007615 [Rhamnusium bicolor]